MFFSYLWLVLLLIAAGWVDFWCLQLALQGFLCAARCFWHVGRISLIQHVGFLWHVGRISCEPGSLSPTPDCSLTDLSQTQLRTTTKKGNFPPQTFSRSSCSKMLSGSDPKVISWSLGRLLVPRQGSCSEKKHSWVLRLDSRLLCENWKKDLWPLTCFFSSGKVCIFVRELLVRFMI